MSVSFSKLCAGSGRWVCRRWMRSSLRCSANNLSSFKEKVQNGPNLGHFMLSGPQSFPVELAEGHEMVPYLSPEDVAGGNRKVYFEMYGCQMNVSDAEIAWSILKNAGYKRTLNSKEADVMLLVTCSIREKAEQKVWMRLKELSANKRKHPRKFQHQRLGLLGCMAERLKKEALEKEKMVDLVAGPDAYRDLPRLLAVTGTGEKAINVQLSMEETYADITPVRLSSNSLSAFVSIMRGCDNMCSYCIVPFTRGRERSRDMSSILDEVRQLSDQGVKELILLGQNVNSYRDTSEKSYSLYGSRSDPTVLSDGFHTIYKTKQGGLRFAELLDRVAGIDREMRIGFTSPHPKDFPDELLEVIQKNHNCYKYIHIPAQSGSSAVLQRMRRGHTREAYLELIKKVRTTIPNVTLSSDFIVGFCGETEEDYEQTLSLIDQIGYDHAFLFAYSVRKKTHAYHNLEDDVPLEVKKRRLAGIHNTFFNRADILKRAQIGRRELVLIEGDSVRSSDQWSGRNMGFMISVLPKDVPVSCALTGASNVTLKPGDYVEVEVVDSSKVTLHCRPLCRTTIARYHENKQHTR